MSNLSLQFAHHGDPSKVLEMNEVPFDFSAPVPPGCVRVRIHARAINPADLLFVEGLYDSSVGDQIEAGRKQTGGSESSGVVLAVGEGVTSVAVGHRVYANSAMPATRTWALVADVAAKNVIPLPDPVSFEAGAQLLVNPLTAIGFLETMKETGLVSVFVTFFLFSFVVLCRWRETPSA
jgi:NADPH:quinone reductase-like Zn-dependent oxidoreductase